MLNQSEEYSGVLSPDLIRRAYKTSNELAWSRSDAIRLIDGLVKAGFVILGVDVWVPSSPGPTMTGWDWNQSESTSPGRPQTAREFVETFKWGSNDDSSKAHEPYFNLTTADKPTQV